MHLLAFGISFLPHSVNLYPDHSFSHSSLPNCLKPCTFTPEQHVARTSNMLPGNMLLQATCCLACISATCMAYMYPLYPAITDWQQTGNVVAGNMLLVVGNMLPWCKRGFKLKIYLFLKSIPFPSDLLYGHRTMVFFLVFSIDLLVWFVQ